MPSLSSRVSLAVDLFSRLFIVISDLYVCLSSCCVSALEALDAIGVRSVYAGSQIEPKSSRQEIVSRFELGTEDRVLLIELDQGARGLNLQSVSRVIVGSTSCSFPCFDLFIYFLSFLILIRGDICPSCRCVMLILNFHFLRLVI